MATFLRGASSFLWTSTLSRKCWLLKPKISTQMAVQFGSLRDPLPEKPVQYSSSKASKLTIADIFGFNPKKRDISLVRKIALAIVLFGITIYIFVREENELDEMFTLDSETVKRASELLDLKLKLRYCLKNNLPTDALLAKIQELEKDNVKPSPFRV